MGRRRTGSSRGSLARGGEKKGFKTAFEAEIVTEIEALVGTGALDEWDFEAIEMAVRRKAMAVAARAVERRLNADTSDHAGPMSPCACGQLARHAGVGAALYDGRPAVFVQVSKLPWADTVRVTRTLHWKDLRAAGTCVRLVVAKRKDTESLEICREHNMEGWQFSGGAVHPGPSISTFSHIASRDQLQYTELRIQESLRGPSEKL